MIEPPQNFTVMSIEGAEVALTITWNCNLDKDSCDPQYSARRVDTIDDASGGYNFRFAKYWYDGQGIQYRTLTKAYGILFVVEIDGQGGKFSMAILFFRLGSTLALLGIAAVLSDMVVLSRHSYYREQKYHLVSSKDLRSPSTSSENRIMTTSIFDDKKEPLIKTDTVI